MGLRTTTMPTENDSINIPLTDTMRTDVISMIADLLDLQESGTFKVYGIPAHTQAETAIFSLRCAIGNLTDEDTELVSELRA